MKKNILLKIFSLTVCSIMVLSSGFGCGEEEIAAPSLPEYALNTETAYYAFNGPSDGVYYFDNEKKQYDSNRTVEGYKKYKEAGFDTVLLSGSATFSGDTNSWTDTNETVKAFNNAVEAGIEKIVLVDDFFENLIVNQKLVGDKTFDVEIKYDEKDSDNDGVSDELFEDVYNELKIYCYKKGFYGIQLGEKPRYDVVKSYGNVYKAIRLATKKLYEEGVAHNETDGIVKTSGYICINLVLAEVDYNDMSKFYAEELEDPTGEKYYESYKDSYTRYVEGIIDACGGGYNEQTKTGVAKLSVGITLFRKNKIADGFYSMLQLWTDICNKKGVKISYVCQSMTAYTNDALMYDRVSQAEMAMEFYSAIGFGITDIAYNSYMPSTNYSTTGFKSMDDGCFLARDGKENNIYYFGQSVLAEAKKLSMILSNYKFCGSKLYFDSEDKLKIDSNVYLKTIEDTACDEGARTLDYENGYRFKALKEFSFSNDVALVTELKDSENSLYMYMIQNNIDPRNSQFFDTFGTATVKFSEEYNYVAVIENGEVSYQPLTNGTYTKGLSAGYAVFLVPIKLG